MGLFSKKKTFVATNYISLVEDVPNVLERNMANIIMSDQPTVEALMDSYLQGLAVNLHNVYWYAEHHYTRGLPEGQMDYTRPSSSKVLSAIQANHSQEVVLVSAIAAKLDTEFLVLDYLMTQRGLVTPSYEVTNPPFTAKGTVTFMDHWIAGSNHLRIKYKDVYQERNWEGDMVEATDYHEEDWFTPFNPHALYVHAVYMLKDAGTVVSQENYWSYQVGTGTYPGLDDFASYKLSSKYYPIVPLREHNQKITDADHGELYRTGKQMLNKIGVDYNELITAIDENPDVADIDHSYFMIAANLQSDEQMTLDYLYRYFKYLRGYSTFSKADYEFYLQGKLSGSPDMNTLTIKDGELEMTLNYLYIDVTQYSGNVGEVGSVTKTNTILPRQRAESGRRWGGQDNYMVTHVEYEVSEYMLEYQLDANTVERVVVKGLLHINNVYRNHTVETSLEDSLNEDTNNFLIPINHELARDYGLVEETQLFQDCLIVIFQSYVVKKLKWYQTGFFQFVTVVIAVAVTLYTGMDLISAAVSASSITAAVIAVIEKVVISMVVSTTFQFVVEQIGIEAALVMATLLAAYSITSTTNWLSTEGLPFAEEALMLSGALQTGIKGSYQAELEGIQDEFSALEAERDEFEKELEAAQGLLENDSLLNPLMFINPNETVEQYLYRSTHSGNIGVLTLDMIENFVGYSLQLPNPEF